MEELPPSDNGLILWEDMPGSNIGMPSKRILVANRRSIGNLEFAPECMLEAFGTYVPIVVFVKIGEHIWGHNRIASHFC